MKKILCTICARGGSKGVPHKNLRKLQGIPLIAHTIRQAQDAEIFSAIAVSSDSAEILRVAKEYGVSVLVERPAEMATDTAPKVPAIRHCVEEAERQLGESFDICVDLDVASPLRNTSDIIGAVNVLMEKKVSNVVSGFLSKRSPYFDMVEVDDTGVVRLSKTIDPPVTCRQNAPLSYDLNASVFVWTRKALQSFKSIFLFDTALFEMPEERSIEIDSEIDWQLVSLLMKK